MKQDKEEYLDFEQALNRLHKIVDIVRDKELGLEESIDMLEEAVQLANICTENIDKTQWINPDMGETYDQSNVPRK